MSLNWVMLDERKQPVPLPSERIITTVPDAQVTIHIPQSNTTLTAPGSIWLTSNRFIFVASPQATGTSLLSFVSQAISPNDSEPTMKLESLSLPWLSVLSTSFVQPYFAANYLSIDIRPAPDGGLSLGTTAQVRLIERGMFEFIKSVEGVRNGAIERAREARMGEPLPVYPATATTDDLPPGYSA